MGDTGKSREQLLQEWKEQRELRSASTIVNGVNDQQPAMITKPTNIEAVPLHSPQQQSVSIALDDENMEDKSLLDDQSSRKPALPGPQKQQMEQTFDLLRNRLHAIKRDSLRPSISGTVPPAAPPVAPVAAAPPPSNNNNLVTSRPRPEESVAAPQQQFGGIFAKLESLKGRESIRPAAGAASVNAGVQFEAAGQYDTQALSKLAVQLFDDKEFLALCDKGLNAELTRSKDGATSETKIQELAGIVKLLRRAMKEVQHRSQAFIDNAIKFEKEAAQQVESVKLSSESSTMAMQAELANARREAATTAANHKTALATWQAELDMHKAEVANLKREMERVEGERDKAREDARRLDALRQTLEADLKDARKAAGQRERELNVDRNAAAQQVYEAREAFERQRLQLNEALAAAETRATEAETTVASLRRQLAETQSAVAETESRLEATTREKDALAASLEALQNELMGRSADNEKLAADGAAALSELGSWREKAASLMVELEKERGELAALRQELETKTAAYSSERAEWAAAKASAGNDAVAAAERERALLEEKSELKSSLAAALAQVSSIESSTAAEIESLKKELAEAMEASTSASTSLEEAQQQAETLKKELSKLTEEVASLNARTEESEHRRAEAEREAEDKGQRLAQIEGELEALQECTIGLGSGDQREMIGRMISRIAALEAAVAAAEAARRDIHNQLVELKGNIRVFARVRPHPTSIVSCEKDNVTVKLYSDGKEHPFSFDKVFGPDAGQQKIFDEVSDVVQSALDGYKVCLFSYGQTGAGKTHTMLGTTKVPGQEGIVPRAVSKILSCASRLRDQGWEYSLEASYVEVYNETLRDLLAENQSKARITENNAIQHAPNGGHTVVLGATRVPVASEEDAAALVRRAASARAVESTAMNATSSRSHSIFMLYITGKHEASATVLQGSLNLVDLAGSERLNRSQAEGARAREACNINKSLSSLGDVFQALSTKAAHIPYRNSKLTHLLQPCLGGSGKTLMFVNINPEPDSANESLCSLRFAAKVNACETAAKGGATRNITSLSNTSNDPFSGAGRMSMSGRPSIAPSDGGSRRMSMAPSAMGGAKRKAGIPPTGGTSGRLARPRMN